MNYMNYTYTMPVIPSGDMGQFYLNRFLYALTSEQNAPIVLGIGAVFGLGIIELAVANNYGVDFTMGKFSARLYPGV